MRFRQHKIVKFVVALRKESVDRNPPAGGFLRPCGVALRKESVDRNVINEKPVTDQDGSLSARRAWIEMLKRRLHEPCLVGRSPQGERG